jgi:hypothetical protein
MVDGSQLISFANGVGDERGVVDTARHIPLVAGKENDVLEVQVACFEYAHDLNAFNRFSMKRNRGRLNQLVDKAQQGVVVDIEVAVLDKCI